MWYLWMPRSRYVSTSCRQECKDASVLMLGLRRYVATSTANSMTLWSSFAWVATCRRRTISSWV